MDNKNNEAVDGVVASEEISLEEQQAVLEKFDQESNTRNVTGFAKGFIKWYAIAMAVFHVYTSFFGLWATIRQRAMHLLFVMAYMFCETVTHGMPRCSATSISLTATQTVRSPSFIACMVLRTQTILHPLQK